MRDAEEECDRLKRKNQVLQEYLDAQKKQCDTMHENLVKSEKQIIRMQAHLDEIASNTQKQQIAHAEQVRQIVSQYELKLHNVSASSNTSKLNLADTKSNNALIKRMETEITNLKHSLEQEVERVREYEEKCVSTEHAKQRLAAQYDEMCKHVKILEEDYSSQLKQQNHLFESLHTRQKQQFIKRYEKVKAIAKSKIELVAKQFKLAQEEILHLQEQVKIEQVNASRAKINFS